MGLLDNSLLGIRDIPEYLVHPFRSKNNVFGISFQAEKTAAASIRFGLTFPITHLGKTLRAVPSITGPVKEASTSKNTYLWSERDSTSYLTRQEMILLAAEDDANVKSMHDTPCGCAYVGSKTTLSNCRFKSPNQSNKSLPLLLDCSGSQAGARALKSPNTIIGRPITSRIFASNSRRSRRNSPSLRLGGK